jgi:DNA repair exonuclease SbcCD ATPase subunit
MGMRSEQKWMDMETRMLTNWQEFVKHRQEVQLQLHEIHDSLQRAAGNETAAKLSARWETEVSRYASKMQQLAQAQDDLANSMSKRMDDLQSTVDTTQESLRDRVSKKFMEITSLVDSQQHEASDRILHDALDAAKRTSRAVAEDLLRKMEELNGKLGDNMEHLEEQSAWSLQRVQQDVKDLASKVDGASFAAEAEVRKLEARLESVWRHRLSEVEAQFHDLSERNARLERESGLSASEISKLESRMQDCKAQTEQWEAALKQLGQRFEWSNARLEEVQASNLEQVGRAREDMFALVSEQQNSIRKALDSQLEDASEALGSLTSELHTSVQRLESQGRLASDALDKAEEQSTSHARVIAELKDQMCVLGDNFTSELAHTSEAQEKIEGRLVQMVREVNQQVAELHSASASQQTQHASVFENLTEKFTKIIDKTNESVRQSSEAVSHLQQACDTNSENIAWVKERHGDQIRDTEGALKRFEADLRETRQLSERQSQDSKLESLRIDVTGHVKRHSEEIASTLERIQALDHRLVQESELQTRQIEKRIEGVVTRFSTTLADHESQLKRAFDSCQDVGSKTVEDLRTALHAVEEQAKTRQDGVLDKASNLQAQISELKALVVAAAAATQQRDEQVNSEFEQRAKTTRDESSRLEARVAEVSSSTSRAIESAEQRLQGQLETSAASLMAKWQSSQAEAATIRSQSEEGRRIADSKFSEISTKLDELEQREVADLRTQIRGLGENIANQQAQICESQQKMEGRLVQMVRDVNHDVAELQATSRSVSGQLASQQSQHAAALSRVQEDLAERLNKESSTLTDLVQQTRQIMTEATSHLQQVCDTNNEHVARVKERHDSLLLDSGLMQKRFEADLQESRQVAERQVQELHQQLAARCAESDSKLDALRIEVAGHAKRQADETASTLGRVQALDHRLSQEKDRSEIAVDAQTRQFDKRLEGITTRFSASIAEHEAQLKRASDTCHEVGSKAADDLRQALHGVEEQAKSRHDGLLEKASNLQTQVSEIKALVVAATATAQQREEQVNAEFERRARTAKDEDARLEARVVEVGATSSRALEAAEQHLRGQLDAAMSSIGAKLHSAQVEIDLIKSKAEEGRHTSETKFSDITARLDELKDQAQTCAEDFERRSTRHTEGLEASKRHNAEQAEGLRKKIADVQQGADQSVQQRCAEVTAQSKAALFEVSQKLARDAATATTELRARLDEVTERLGLEMREAHAGIHTKVNEVQGDFRGQITSERTAMQTLLTESIRQQDDRLRELGSTLEREHARGEVQFGKHLEEAQRNLKREITEAFLKVETASAAALERELELVKHAVEDVRRCAASATKEHTESTDRRFREQADHHTKAHSELSDQLSSLDYDHRSLHTQVQTKSQGLEERCNELKEQLLIAEKDLRQVAEELPSMARRWDSTRHAQSAALDEFKRSSTEQFSHLQRKTQASTDLLSQLTHQLTSVQEEWKVKHRDAEEASHAAVVGVQKQAQEEVVTLRSEVTSAQTMLQNINNELTQAARAQREKQNIAMTELGRRTEEWFMQSQRRFDEVEAASAQARIIAIVGEQAEGMIKAVASQELQAFQREALDAVEWKLERCVQWLHGANVKLGLNPHGTMFSTDRFRAMLFDEAARPGSAAGATATVSNTPRSRRRPQSAQPLRKGTSGVRASP